MLKATKHIIGLSFLLIFLPVYGQKITRQSLKICWDSLSNRLKVKQKIYFDYGNHTTDSLLLLNWANAYYSKKTALAKRFIENYDLNFHFTRAKNRGFVQIDRMLYNGQKVENIQIDDEFYRIKLPQVLSSSQDSLLINYQLKLPNQKFTGYGIDKNDNILLEDFYFQPVFESAKMYRHKNIDHYPAYPVDFNIELCHFDPSKKIYSNLAFKSKSWQGKVAHLVFLITNNIYVHYRIGQLNIRLPSKHTRLSDVDKSLIIKKIISFLNEETDRLLPSQNILISHKDYRDYKVYGPDLLPGFLNPYDSKLLWEAEVLHQLVRKYVSAMQLDRRQNPWLSEGIAAYWEYKYFETYYPYLKLLGKLSDKWLVRFYYASQVKINEKYPWLYLYMARMNKDQALQTRLDSLSNFNRNVANPFKAALGFVMLKDEMGEEVFQNTLRKFYRISLKKPVDIMDFYREFDIKNRHAWFITYIETRQKYDYKLLKINKINDNVYKVKIRNKKNHALPLSLFALSHDSILHQKSLPLFLNDTVVRFRTTQKPEFIGLNYFNNYPEIQNKNNYKKVNKRLLSKPLQIRLYQDFDNPLKTQFFVNPFFEYNYYDGVILGLQVYNESFLHNYLNYSLSPSYSTKDKSLTGGFSLNNTHYFENFKPFALKYGFNFKYYHYDHNLAYRRFNPYLVFKFRNKYLRKRQGSNLLLQYMYINKDPGLIPDESDTYAVLNLNYSNFDVNIIKDLFYKTDLQIARKFGKLSGMIRYRYLTNRNRQWDFRVYAGVFLYNHTHTDYFSFALDRPTDYLFQYHYYGRSETSGIFHQQFIWAEGGFKTFFLDQYANEFIISNNLNIGVWKWFNLYGDWAWKKNRGAPLDFYYDSGARINLVQDYFEVFFPVYSKLGWEIKEPDYWQRIRLVFTIDINGLFKMIRRGWY